MNSDMKRDIQILSSGVHRCDIVVDLSGTGTPTAPVYRLHLVGNSKQGSVLTLERRAPEGDPVPVYEWQVDFWVGNAFAWMFEKFGEGELDMILEHNGAADVVEIVKHLLGACEAVTRCKRPAWFPIAATVEVNHGI